MPNRILIVDDDPMIRHFVDLVLTQQGFKVVTAASSDTAMQLLGREGFALVLLDINMPGMSGLDVLRLMRARPGRPKILMMTAHRDPATIMKALEQGADGYLAKPFKPQDLLKRIETVLKGPAPAKPVEISAPDELILD
ncbi:response regulator transcription factor [Caulobacter segnis]